MRCLHIRKAVSAVILCAFSLAPAWAEAADRLRVTTFQCDVTPPLGQPMFACDVLCTVEQPLLAKGIVLEAGAERYVLCALDWCEICNETYDSMRSKIAAAAGTTAAHVALQTVHQHTAPLVDTSAQKLLAEAGAPSGIHLDPQVYAEIYQRLAAAVKQSLDKFELFDQIGTGQAKVDRVASSRRPRDAAGKVRPRASFCPDPAVRALPEGPIDPYLKTITLAQGQKPLVRLHYYATHPQTKYGDGRASSDIVGNAREQFERKEHVFQIYFTGCGGDITVGKYNDGSPQCRKELAERILAGMEAAAAATKLVLVGQVRWRTYPLLLPRRTDPGFNMADCLARMKAPKVPPVNRIYRGAIRVAFLQRSGQPTELSSLEIGNVRIVHLPGEPLVDFQLFAQSLKPADFVAVAGYGDCGPGYICPEETFRDGSCEPSDECVKPESAALLKKAIAALLGSD